VAGNTEWQRVGRFHEGIETTPQNNTGHEKEHRREQRGVSGKCFQAGKYYSHSLFVSQERSFGFAQHGL
jgi:hypothetical protein